MSIDANLYSAIESNNSIKDKSWFENNLMFAKAIYDTYDVDYNFDNVLDIIKVGNNYGSMEKIYYIGTVQ